MRALVLFFIGLFSSSIHAGFTVSGWCSASPCASLDSIESYRGTYQNLFQPAAVESGLASGPTLADCCTLPSSEVAVFMTAPGTGNLKWSEASRLVNVYLITKDAISANKPSDIRVDLCFDFNGVPMGGLSSITGIPNGNGQGGIVKLDGLDGTLLQHNLSNLPTFGYESLPYYEDPIADVAEQAIFVLVLMLIFLTGARQHRLAPSPASVPSSAV